ncbi:MAG: glycosyltransferase family 4 protein [Nitrospirae bacterium]|nr:glycosyltransferase family 4 protein [Nitrospirota bacterium]
MKIKYEVISLQPLPVRNFSFSEVFNYMIKEDMIKIKFIEFSFFRQIMTILRGYEGKLYFLRIIINMFNLIKLLLSKNKTIIIGAAPYSIVIFLLNRLKSRHKCIFYTSWPFWDGERFPEKIYLTSQRKAWHKFLDGMVSAGVTKSATDGVAKYGAKSFHIPHSIDTNLFAPSDSKPASDKLRVLYIGKLVKIKGLPLLISLIKNNKWENIEFQVAGGGPFENEIVGLEKEGGPVKYLGFTKNQKDLVSIYQNADMLIVPSYHENFSVVIIEAMACRLPVIATGCAGPKEIIEDGADGIIVPVNDEGALKNAVLKLAASPELRDRLAKNGRKKAEQIYNLEAAARRWLTVLETVHKS